MIFFILSFIVVVPPSLRARTPPDSLEMEKLREEHEELQKNLRASASQSRRQADSHDAQQLRALLNRRDELNEQLERERLSQAELDREVMTFRHQMRTHTLTHCTHTLHTHATKWLSYLQFKTHAVHTEAVFLKEHRQSGKTNPIEVSHSPFTEFIIHGRAFQHELYSVLYYIYSPGKSITVCTILPSERHCSNLKSGHVT